MTISIYLRSKKNEEIQKFIIKEKIDTSNFEIHESQRVSAVVLKINFFFSRIKFSSQAKIQNLKEFIKFGNLEKKVGGGGIFDFETYYHFAHFTFVSIIFPGIAFDLTKVIFKKIYKYFKEKKLKYLLFITPIRMPNDTRIRILLPNNIDDNDLDWVLIQAGEIMKNLDNARSYFGFYYVDVRFDSKTRRWTIKPKRKIKY